MSHKAKRLKITGKLALMIQVSWGTHEYSA
jgi:hypothetical protein